MGKEKSRLRNEAVPFALPVHAVRAIRLPPGGPVNQHLLRIRQIRERDTASRLRVREKKVFPEKLLIFIEFKYFL